MGAKTRTRCGKCDNSIGIANSIERDATQAKDGPRGTNPPSALPATRPGHCTVRFAGDRQHLSISATYHRPSSRRSYTETTSAYATGEEERRVLQDDGRDFGPKVVLLPGSGVHPQAAPQRAKVFAGRGCDHRALRLYSDGHNRGDLAGEGILAGLRQRLGGLRQTLRSDHGVERVDEPDWGVPAAFR